MRRNSCFIQNGLPTLVKTVALLLLLLLPSGAVMGDTSTRMFRNFSAADGLADNSAQVIACTKTGRLVITTMGQINFYDGQRFQYIDPTDKSIFPLDNYRGNYHLYFDRYHHIWLKNTHSVTCVDLGIEKFVSSVENVFKEFGMTKQVKDLFVDGENIVWLLTDDGLYNVKTKNTTKVRRDLNLQDLEVYNENQLLLFYENGLMEIIDLATGNKVHESCPYGEADKSRFRNSSVLRMNDHMLYQIRNGEKEAVLNQLNLDTRQWKEILRTPYHLNNFAQRDTLLYIPCEYGYWVYDAKGDRLKHAENLQLENGQLLNTDINVMCFDRQGGLWAGTEKRGLLYSMPFRSPFNVYRWGDQRADQLGARMEGMDRPVSFRNRSVNCVTRDSRGWTWVGTPQGLQLYRKSSDVLPQLFTTRDGLLNNVVHSVVEDKNHCMWVTTSYGLTCFQVDNGKIGYIMSYNRYDRIPNEMFVNGKAMCLPSGEIVLQSLDHVVTFDPDRVSKFETPRSFELYPKLIRMMVNGNEVHTGQEVDGKVILEKAISRTYQINLNYDQNSASLVFSALNFFRPQQTCYRVRIKGLIDDWKVYTSYNSGGMVDSRGLFHLPLMSLRPGVYTIELQASMLPDQWNTTPYEWQVVVDEPWWRTTGLFVLFAFLLIALLGINTYFYLRNANLRARRNSGERGIIKRISNISKSCMGKGELVIEPASDEISGEEVSPQDEMDPEFLKVMEKIMPFVVAQNQDPKARLSMRQLSAEAGLDVQKFYRLVSDNIYKNPRTLFRKVMLDRAEKLLRNRVVPLDRIAQDCGFISTNYFIALFYRTHHKTPAEFRETL